MQLGRAAAFSNLLDELCATLSCQRERSVLHDASVGTITIAPDGQGLRTGQHGFAHRRTQVIKVLGDYNFELGLDFCRNLSFS